MLKRKLFSDAGNGNPPPKDPPPIKEPNKDDDQTPIEP